MAIGLVSVMSAVGWDSDKRSIPCARRHFDLELDIDGVFSLSSWFERAYFEEEVRHKVDFTCAISFAASAKKQQR